MSGTPQNTITFANETVQYSVIFTSASAYATAVAGNGGSTSITGSPNAAAATYSLPVASATPTAPPGEVFISDFNTFYFDIDYLTTGQSHFPANGSGETNHVASLDIRTKAGVASFTLDYYQDVPGVNAGGNHYIVTYTWHGTLVLQGTYNPTPPSPAVIQSRRWIQGFEAGAGGGSLGPSNADNTGFSANALSRAASRCTDGYGWTMTSGATATHRMQTSPSGAAGRPTSSWERLYIRVRARPAADEICFWAATEDTEGQRETLHLSITAAGNLRARNVGAGAPYPGVVIGTFGSALTLNTWYKLDIFLTFSPGPSGAGNPGGTVFVFINNVVWLNNVTVAAGTGGTNGTGLGFAGAKHHSSIVGNFQTGSAGAGTPTLYAIDLDDWVNAAIPPANATTGADFKNGSHIRRVLPTAFGPGNGTWTGDFRTLQNFPIGVGLNGPGTPITSSTASTPLVVTTDYVDAGIGCAALVTAVLNRSVPAVAVQNGYQIGAGSQVLVGSGSLTPGNNTWFGSLFNLAAGSLTPSAISSLNLITVRGASGVSQTIDAMIGAAEYLGVFGPEDAASDAVTPPLAHTGLHNAHYPDHPSAVDRSKLLNAKTLTGTYVGNGTGQDIVTTDPIHLLFIRQASGGSLGLTTNWWTSLSGAHTALDGNYGPHNVPSAYPLSGNQAGFRVDSGSGQSNVNGVTHRWVGISDPSARFALNTANWWNTAITSAVTTLIDAGFTPEAAFAWLEQAASANTLYYKGPGHTTDKASALTVAETSAIFSLAAGSITSKTALHANSGSGQAFSALRSVDQDGVQGLIDMVTYVGDGLASRNIPASLGGFPPLYTLGIAHTTGPNFSFVRDPSHTALDSSIVNGGISTTGIINHSVNDTVVVGSSLNANGITYDLFVISSIGLVPPGLHLTCPTSSAAINIPYSSAVGVIGGVTPYTFSITSGSLPPGLSLGDGTVLASGAVVGTPTVLGTYPVTFQVRDATGAIASVGCTIVVGTGGGGPLAVGCATATGAVAATYDSTVPATGGSPPYTFAIIAGGLPPGLTLNTSSGRITGVPSTAGTYNYTIQVTDSLAAVVSTPCSITISAITITVPPLGACLACTTLTDAIALLALRLQDSGLVHWTGAELTRYLIEAVRTWQAVTGHNIAQGSFFTQIGVPFYDIPTVLPALRAYTVKDRDLILDLEYSLMEPPTNTAWTGTPQFILNDLIVALEHRRDRFLYETGMIVNRFVMAVLAPPASGRITFDPSIMTIRRAAYQNTLTGATYPLSRDDEWSLQSFLRTWPAQTAVPATLDPQVYSVGVTPPLTLQLGPPLSNPGVLDLLVISRTGVGGQTTPCLDPNNGTGIFIGIPDDWTWVVKFGALAELLNQQGVTYDPQRAGYCESRWRHGLSLARNASTVLAARINGQPISLDSVPNMDNYSRAWQRTSGTPVNGGLAGNNLVALTPVPTGTSHTVTLDVVRNIPVPAAGSDCLGVEGEALDAILDYAEHLALFKEGPDQVRGSMDMLDRFFRFCGVKMGVDWASSIDLPALNNQTRSDERFQPRQIAPPDAAPPSLAPPTPSTGPS